MINQWKRHTHPNGTICHVLPIGCTLVAYVEERKQEEGQPLWSVRVGGKYGRFLKRKFLTRIDAQFAALKLARKVLKESIAIVNEQEHALTAEQLASARNGEHGESSIAGRST